MERDDTVVDTNYMVRERLTFPFPASHLRERHGSEQTVHLYTGIRDSGGSTGNISV